MSSYFWSDRLRVVSGILIAIVIAIFGTLIEPHIILPGPDSKEALLSNPGELIAYKKGIVPHDSLITIVHHPIYKATEDVFVSAVDSLYSFLKSEKFEGDPLFHTVKSAGHSLLGDENFISKDNHHVLIIADSISPIFDTPMKFKDLSVELEKWRDKFPDFQLSYISNGTINNELFDLINRDLDRSLIYTIPITLLILLWTFRSVGAAILTIFLSTLCLISSLGLSVIVSRYIGPISATAQQLVVLLVMAIATDYSLFFLSRVRAEVALGASYIGATLKTQLTTGKAIFWSGITVATSLLGLFLMNDTVLASMAIVSMLSVFVTLIYIRWLLPSLIRLLQNKIEFAQLRTPKSDTNTKTDHWISWSCSNPKLALIVSIIPLLLLSYFFLDLKLGSTVQPKMMPSSMESIHGYQVLKDSFPDLSGTELYVIVSGQADIESNTYLQDFFDSLHNNERLHGPFNVQKSEDETTFRYKFIIDGTSADESNVQWVQTLRTIDIPRLYRVSGIQALISGKLAYDIDQRDLYSQRTWAVFAVILCLSFVFLLVAFKSIVIPIKAIVLNLLSTGSSFGLLVLCFQISGYNYGVIESFVPALLFSILFGLSMDYHLILISRIREEHKEDVLLSKAIQLALQETYGVITSAAAIMISVFIVIATLELPIMKQLGIGLACAVLIDASIIRCILLPASMQLLGEWNWYLPAWMKKLEDKLQRSRYRNC